MLKIAKNRKFNITSINEDQLLLLLHKHCVCCSSKLTRIRHLLDKVVQTLIQSHSKEINETMLQKFLEEQQ